MAFRQKQIKNHVVNDITALNSATTDGTELLYVASQNEWYTKTGTVSKMVEAAQTVDTIALLQSYSGPRTQLQVLDTQGSGMWFTYVTTGTHDGGIYFTATGKGSGFWKREYDNIAVNIDWYGADNTGVLDATTAFNNAFITNKDVLIGNGTYKVSGLIEITSNLKFNKNSIVKIANNSTGNIFHIGNKKNIKIQNSYIDATGTNINVSVFKIEGLWNSSFDNTTILFNSSDTSSIAFDFVSSLAASPAFGCYNIDFKNIYVNGGSIAIKTRPLAADIGVATFTHFGFYNGWLTGQKADKLDCHYLNQVQSYNIAIETVAAGFNRFNLQNCSEWIWDIAEITNTKLANLVNCSFIHFNFSKSFNVTANITGDANSYSYTTSGKIRLNSSTNDPDYYTEIASNYSYANAFEINGKFGSGLTSIFKYNDANGTAIAMKDPLGLTTGLVYKNASGYLELSKTTLATTVIEGFFVVTADVTTTTSYTIPVTPNIPTGTDVSRYELYHNGIRLRRGTRWNYTSNTATQVVIDVLATAAFPVITGDELYVVIK